MELLKTNLYPLAAIFILSFCVYANTLNSGFVLDDKIVVTENVFTKKGVSGIVDIFNNDSMTGFFGGKRNLVAGGRYRPLSMATHAVEWELVEDKPFMYHFNNVLLYAISGILLFLILLNLFPTAGLWYLTIPFMTTLLFQINPLHTEVVANIKSRDEILSIVFAFSSFLLILQYFKQKNKLLLLASGVLFFLGLLSKESAIVFVGLIPVFIYVLKKEIKLTELTLPVLSLVLASIGYLAIRYQIIGGINNAVANQLMNNPFLDSTSTETWATIFYTLFIYLKLLFYPHPLTHDYYPMHIEIIDWSSPIAITSVLIHVGIIALFIVGVWKKRFYGLVAGIYLGGIFLYSNILFPIGTFMNERFLYIPSLGLTLLIAWAMHKFIKSSKIQVIILVILVGLYSAKTYSRNFAWESDASLALIDIEISKNSAKCNMAAGQALLDRANKEKNSTKQKKDYTQSIVYLKKAMELHPKYNQPILLLGNSNTGLKKYDDALYYYELCLNYNIEVVYALQNLEYLAQEATNEEKYTSAEKAFLLYLKYKPNAKIEEKLGELYGKNMGELQKSIEHLELAYEVLPHDPDINQKLGVAYAISGNSQKAITFFEKGVELDPKNANLWINLGYAHGTIGNKPEMDSCLERAYQLKPELRPSN